MAAALSPQHIFKQSSKLSAVKVIGCFVALAVNIVAARVLGPEKIGILALIGAWVFYLRLVRPGLISAASREIPHLLGKGQAEQARALQNIALTGELAWTFVPCLVLLGVGFFYSSALVRFGFWASSAAFLVNFMQEASVNLLAARQRFDLIARWNAVMSIAAPLGVLLTIHWLGVYAPLLIPAAAAGIALVFMRETRKAISYRPQWNWPAARSMAKVGISLTLLTLVLWAYFMSDRPAILAAGLSLTAVGYYAFASNIVRGVAQVFWDFTGVLQPILWKEMGRRGSVAAVRGELVRLWIPYMVAGCTAVTLGQAAFGAVVAWLVPRFAPSVAVFELLAFLLVFQNATQLPNLILNSTTLGRQNTLIALWSAGLAFNVAVLYALARAGFSLKAIAAASMAIDLAVAIAGYAAIHRYLFSSWRQARGFYSWLCAAAAAVVGLYAAFQQGIFAYQPRHEASALMWRLLLSACVWGVFWALVYRWRYSGESAPDGEVLALAPQPAMAESEIG